MKIILAGATGFIGTALVELLNREAHALTLLTRIKKPLTLSGATTIVWQPGSSGDWRPALDDAMTDADGVINLAGESLAAGRRREAREGKVPARRIGTTR